MIGRDVGLTDEELTSIKAFKLLVETNMGFNTFAKLRYTFPELECLSLKIIRSQICALSAFDAVLIDCCEKICHAYTGGYSDLEQCAICGRPRYDARDRPNRRYQYLPIIPQIQALYAGEISSIHMRYRSLHKDDHIDNDNNTISDVYDSNLYRHLRQTQVVVGNHVLPHKYFEADTDVMLHIITDGFQLFEKSPKSSWPMVAINQNLPPAIRAHLPNILCFGIIPGKPEDFDSFFFPFVEEMHVAAVGVESFDAHMDKMFPLRIYTPTGGGDMPAMCCCFCGSKIPGAKHPCRGCPIEGVRIIGTSNIQHYIPLSRRPARYPSSAYSVADPPPVRTHREWMTQARLIDVAPTVGESDALSTHFGITRTALFTRLPGVCMPWSVPFDLMHLASNMARTYIELFGGTYKGMDAGREDYIIRPKIWEAIGVDTVKANATIPSQFRRPMPDPSYQLSYFTSEALIVWTTLYAPILLRDRFPRPKYYTHYMRFVSILERLMNFTSTFEERNTLRRDIAKWCIEYEKYVVFYYMATSEHD